MKYAKWGVRLAAFLVIASLVAGTITLAAQNRVTVETVKEWVKEGDFFFYVVRYEKFSPNGAYEGSITLWENFTVVSKDIDEIVVRCDYNSTEHSEIYTDYIHIINGTSGWPFLFDMEIEKKYAVYVKGETNDYEGEITVSSFKKMREGDAYRVEVSYEIVWYVPNRTAPYVVMKSLKNFTGYLSTKYPGLVLNGSVAITMFSVDTNTTSKKGVSAEREISRKNGLLELENASVPFWSEESGENGFVGLCGKEIILFGVAGVAVILVSVYLRRRRG